MKTDLKTIPLMISKVFPHNHPKVGQETGFENGIFLGKKIHTIRANYLLWKKRIDMVNSGEAILSLRHWEGRPYYSKQIEFANFENDKEIGVQIVDPGVWLKDISIDRKYYSVEDVARNDGLDVCDFTDWFKKRDKNKPMAIIHFTGFRY